MRPISPIRHLAVFLSGSFALAGAVPAAAQTPPVFEAELASASSESSIIIRDVAFSCAGTRCTGGKSSSSARMVCGRLVRKTGPVTAFHYKGEPFDAEALAKCND